MILLKRVYEDREPADGFRMLVDRLWPRGVSHDRAHLDLWFKEIAPSEEMRKRFHGEQINFDEFARQYRGELDQNPQTDRLREILTENDLVTFVYATKQTKQNHAIVLKDWALAEFSDR